MLEKYEKAWNFGVQKRKKPETPENSDSETSENENELPENPEKAPKEKVTLAGHMTRPLESQEFLLLLCLILLIAIFLFVFFNPDLMENPLKEDRHKSQLPTLPESEPDSLYENLQQNL